MSGSTFKAWLSGAKATERSVEIVQDGSLLGLWDDWVRRFDRAQETTVPKEERSMGETAGIEALTDEGAALLERIEAARTVWFVRGLQADVLKSIEAAHPEPERAWKRFAGVRPVAPANPTEVQAEAFLKAAALWEEERAAHNEDTAPQMQAYADEARKVLAARGYERVARAFVRAEQGGVTVFTELTAADAAELHAGIGDHEFGKIVNTIDMATDAPAAAPGESDFLLKVSEKTHH